MALLQDSALNAVLGPAGSVESIDPASGALNKRFAATDPSALPAVLERARAAQKLWSAQPIRERCALLQRLRDAILESRDEIAGVITRETGKPRTEAIFAEILLALDAADFFARRAPRWLRPERVPHHNIALKAKSGWLQYEPHGIVAIISPWNFPFSIPLAQIIPALVAGNAVLLKPSELTPWTGALVGELIARVGFPHNVVQVLQGAGELGAAIIDAAPDKVVFTGSVATGRRIAEACGRKLIPSVLELGGKDAMIVLADADLEIASSAAVWGSFTNCGQACLSVERIYVDQSVAQRFTDLCVQKTKKLRVGASSAPLSVPGGNLGPQVGPEIDAEIGPVIGAEIDTDTRPDIGPEIGPMIRLAQLEKVEAQLQDALTRGASILTGGKRLPDLGPNFFEPTVVTGVDHSMILMREETFGPVLAIQSVASAGEAVSLANDSPFALSASIWTSDAHRGRELASQLRAGSVMINDVASYYGIAEAPHGGRGSSGWGRTHSRLGLLEMVQVKYVDVDRLPHMPKSWWYGYSSALSTGAAALADLLFARRLTRRVSALFSRAGARGVIFRRHRI